MKQSTKTAPSGSMKLQRLQKKLQKQEKTILESITSLQNTQTSLQKYGTTIPRKILLQAKQELEIQEDLLQELLYDLTLVPSLSSKQQNDNEWASLITAHLTNMDQKLHDMSQQLQSINAFFTKPAPSSRTQRPITAEHQSLITKNRAELKRIQAVPLKVSDSIDQSLNENLSSKVFSFLSNLYSATETQDEKKQNTLLHLFGIPFDIESLATMAGFLASLLKRKKEATSDSSGGLRGLFNFKFDLQTLSTVALLFSSLYSNAKKDDSKNENKGLLSSLGINVDLETLATVAMLFSSLSSTKEETASEQEELPAQDK